MPTGNTSPGASPGPSGSGGADAPSAPLRRFRVNLSAKIVGIAGASIALVALILAFTFARETEKLLVDETRTRGRLAALSVANTSASLVFAQDITGLEALASATLADVPGAAYVIIRDDRGTVIADELQASLGTARPPAVDLADMDFGGRVVERNVTVAHQDMLLVAALVSFRGKAQAQYLDPLGLESGTGPGAGSADLKVLGSVEIGFPVDQLRARIAAASRRSLALAAIVFAACLVAMYPLARFATRPLVGLSQAALGIAGGDLRQKVRPSGNDEVADLARSFEQMVAGLQSMTSELQEAAAGLAQESSAMLAAATSQASAASQQSASIAQMNASIREIALMSSAAGEHADRVIAVTETAEQSSRAGEGIVEEAVGSTTQVESHVSDIVSRLGDLSGRVGQIGEIIDTVKELSERSTVLSLNAAIQAARSGEAGAAFSVIAREMRELAQQSSRTAGKVPVLLGDIVQSTRAAAGATQQGADKARETAQLARRAGTTIGNLAEVCRESATAARQIADSARQQATGVNDIVAGLTQLAKSAEGNVEGNEETKRVAERLKSISDRLTGLADRYRS